MNQLVVVSQASACSQGDSHTSMTKIILEVLPSTFLAEFSVHLLSLHRHFGRIEYHLYIRSSVRINRCSAWSGVAVYTSASLWEAEV